MSALVIAAHPDDEVLGCGATIAKQVAAGVDVLILGEGITSRHVDRSSANAADLETLRNDARAAATLLGVRELSFAGLPDNRFDDLALLDIVKIVEAAIDRVKPDTIYTHHPGDLNVDHGCTFRAVLTATRPGTSRAARQLLTFEVPSSTEWSFQRVAPPFRPNVFVDVSDTIGKKIAAMACYHSERREAPHPRSGEVLRAVATRWGSVAGIAAAEAFELIRLLC